MKNMLIKATIGILAATMSLGLMAEEMQLSDGKVFTTTDDSKEAQLCLAALESREAIQAKAIELDVSRKTLKKVVCNDKSLAEFAKTHRDDMRDWAIATVQ